MSRGWTIAFAFFAVLIAVQGFYQLASWTSRGGESSPLYSTYRHDPYGSAALYELLEARGVPVERVTRPRLLPEQHGTLVQILPMPLADNTERASVTQSSSQLLDWMHDGNTVIQLTREYTSLMAEANVPHAELSDTDLAAEIEEMQRRGTPPDEMGYAPAPALVGESEDQALALLVPQPFTEDAGAAEEAAPADPRWRWVARRGGQVVAGRQQVGAGELIVIGAPTPALNDGLLRGDNVELMLELLGDGPVLFDEWSLGVGQHHTMLELIRRAGLMPVVLQGLLALVMYHWSTRRQGPPSDETRRRRRSSVEQVQTLGYLYSRSLSDEEVRQRVVAEAQRRLATALRCNVAKIPERAARLPEQQANDVREFVEELQQLNEGKRKVRSERYAAILDRSHSLVKALQK